MNCFKNFMQLEDTLQLKWLYEIVIILAIQYSEGIMFTREM